MQQGCASSDSEWEIVNETPLQDASISARGEALPAEPKSVSAHQLGAADDAGSSVLQVAVQPHVSELKADQASNILGMLSLRVPGIGDLTRLSQLDIVAVVDRSGSMSGQRIQIVKHACKFMVKQMRSSDRFALVSYSNNASVALPLTLLDENGQAECEQAIDALVPGGQTNLGEGLLWGLGELAASDAPAAAVLLFTDGLANKGLTSTGDLVDAMQGPMSDMGRQSRVVFTFGFGQDHNAQMLFALADAGTGCYYYIEKLPAVAPAFADCLGGMLSVCAQDVTVVMRTANGVTVDEVHADFPAEITDEGKEVHVRMRDLCGDAEKDVIFQLRVPPIATPACAWVAVNCDVSYVDAANGVSRTVHSSMLLERPASSEDQVATISLDVEAHRCRLLVAKAMEEAAVACVEQGPAPVKSILSHALEAVDKSPATQSRSGVAQHMEVLRSDLRQCLEHVRSGAAVEHFRTSTRSALLLKALRIEMLFKCASQMLRERS
jgi:hypothetical protein